MPTRPALTALFALLATASAAPQAFDVATSPKGSTAADMFADLGKVCANTTPLRQRQTSGSLENLELLLDNQVSMAFVQLDVLKAKKQIDQDPRADELRTLLPLNFDEIHLISRPVVTKKSMFGKATTTGVTSFSGLAGKKLGAWGGSVVTANVLAAKGAVRTQVVGFKGRDDAMNALQSGQIDGVLAVVGQPADWVKTLDPARFTLLPIDVPAGSVGDFYRPATLRYTQFPQAVATYAVQRILVTRNFKTPEKRAALLAYQKCALTQLTRLQETQGFHPKWSDVTFKEQSWPWFK